MEPSIQVMNSSIQEKRQDENPSPYFGASSDRTGSSIV